MDALFALVGHLVVAITASEGGSASESCRNGGIMNERRDVFISYAANDLDWAEWIGWHLEEARFEVVLQAWDSVPGRNWVADLDAGVRNTDYMVVVATATYLSSPETVAQWTAVWPDHVSGPAVKIVPVLVEDIELTGLLRGHVGIFLAGRREPAARTELLRRMDDVVRGRAKPTRRPPIPLRRRAVPNKPPYPTVLVYPGAAGPDPETPDWEERSYSKADGGDRGGRWRERPRGRSTDRAGDSSGLARSLLRQWTGRVVAAGLVAVVVAGAAYALPGNSEATSGLDPSPWTSVVTETPSFGAATSPVPSAGGTTGLVTAQPSGPEAGRTPPPELTPRPRDASPTRTPPTNTPPTSTATSPSNCSVQRAPAPELAVSPSRGPVTTAIQVSGVGFVGNGKVELYFHADYMGEARTDCAGTFAVTVTIPNQDDYQKSPGQKTISTTQRDGAGGYVGNGDSAYFELTVATSDPTSEPPDGGVIG